MQKFKVVEMTDNTIVFSSLSDMENAYNQLADGKDIIVYYDESDQRKGEILAGKIFSDIIDGKLKLITKEKL